MALLDETRLVAEKARRAQFRLHHVGAKLNEGELREFEALVAKRGQTQAELIRGLILEELKRDPESVRPSAEMVEITACRLLVVNLLRSVATGQPITEKVFDGIIDQVKVSCCLSLRGMLRCGLPELERNQLWATCLPIAFGLADQ